MKIKIIGLFFILFLIFNLENIFANQDLKQIFLDGINAYKSKDYKLAINKFLIIKNSGVKNSKIYYNLGNAYFKNKDFGNAILYYEKALKLDNSDADLKFNYNYAISQIFQDDKKLNQDQFSVFKILFFLQNFLSKNFIYWSAICLNLAFWFILSVLIIRKKRIFRTSLYFLLFVNFIFVLTVFYGFYESVYIKYGIILNSESPVRAGFYENSTKLFVLKAGMKVKIEQEEKDYFKISLPIELLESLEKENVAKKAHNIGWIKKMDLGII